MSQIVPVRNTRYITSYYEETERAMSALSVCSVDINNTHKVSENVTINKVQKTVQEIRQDEEDRAVLAAMGERRMLDIMVKFHQEMLILKKKNDRDL